MPVLMIIRVFWLPHARKAFTCSDHLCDRCWDNVREYSGPRCPGMTNRRPQSQRDQANVTRTVKALAVARLMLIDTLTGLALGIIALVGGNLVLQGELTAGVMEKHILRAALL